jgi:hypothetical protein
MMLFGRGYLFPAMWAPATRLAHRTPPLLTLQKIGRAFSGPPNRSRKPQKVQSVTLAVNAVLAPFAGTFLVSTGVRMLVRSGGVLVRNGLLETS